MDRRAKWRANMKPEYRRAYCVYDSMLQRCSNPSDRYYHCYGGRGIEVRISRVDFIAWHVREAKGQSRLHVDRIDNDGHYELGNIQLIDGGKNVRKAHLESERMKASYSSKWVNMVKARSRRVKVGNLTFPSVHQAGLYFGSGSYVKDRIRLCESRMPDGSEIKMIN